MVRKLTLLFRTPPYRWPVLLLSPLTAPIPSGLWVMNVLAQRFLGVNHDIPVMVHFTSRVVRGGRLELGEGEQPARSLAVSGGCYLQANNGIRIGSGTIFAPGVKIISANHDLPKGGESWKEAPPIEIGRDCWIGANAVILPGVSLGDGCTVGAGAVVTRSFPAGAVLVGVPARASDDAGDE